MRGRPESREASASHGGTENASEDAWGAERPDQASVCDRVTQKGRPKPGVWAGDERQGEVTVWEGGAWGIFEGKVLRVWGLLDLRYKGKESWNFPGGSVVKILCFHCRGHGFHPWLGKFHVLNSVAKKRKRKLQLSLENLGESRSLIQ